MAQTRRMGKLNQKGIRTKSAEVFALLWELSSYREGLQLSFHFFCDVSRLELGHSDF
jgi:hypothetical protein